MMRESLGWGGTRPGLFWFDIVCSSFAEGEMV